MYRDWIACVRLHDVKQHWQQSTPKIKEQVPPGIPTQVYPRLPGLTLYHCDMETDGGGWTVFQCRMNGSVDFYRSWNDYVHDFGSSGGEHWLGLSKLHHLTNGSSKRAPSGHEGL